MNLLAQIETQTVDYSDLKVMLPLSGGINSAAVLCWLGESVPLKHRPFELDIYYSHFVEHSPDTHQFVIDLILYANKHFRCVNSKITWNSVNAYFIKAKMIPHPSISPCSRQLKTEPADKYFARNEFDIELIGYVKTDTVRRGKNKSRVDNLSARLDYARFPLIDWSKQDCLDFVKATIGWYPTIYDIKDEKGKDVFSHNNCLPCKNMHPKQIANVVKYYPEYAVKAQETADAIPGAYWGREDIGIFACDVCERLS